MAKFNDYLYFMDKKLFLEKNKTYRIGRLPSNDICLSEKTISKNHAVITWDGDDIILEDLNSTNSTMVNYEKIEKQKLKDSDKITIGSFNIIYRSFEEVDGMEVNEYDSILTDTLIVENKIAKIIDEIKNNDVKTMKEKIFDLKHTINKSKEKLNFLANVDTLTKLYNRKYFNDNLLKEVERAKRYKSKLCLLMIDVDYFKKFNDKYGHQKGDEVLITIASIIKNNIRVTDIAARYGGEEIVVVLPETNIENAAMVAEKIRTMVENDSQILTKVKVTVSIGAASLDKSDFDIEKIISNADSALYKAKENGRNKIEVFE